MVIPFFTLDRQYKTIQKEIDTALLRTVGIGTFILGDQVAAFETEFKEYLEVPHAVGVGSGTDALTIAIQALGLGAGDEVLVPANCYPTVFGVAQSGVRVRLVDCGSDGNISLSDLPKRMTKRTKAIVVVHLYGNPADVLGVKKIAGRDITIIEDCAQAHGATLRKAKAGTFGSIACFSFYPTKNLGAYGDGGMVVTSNARLARRSRMFRVYGERERYNSMEISGVSRLDELQAAILRVKLRHLDEWNSKRKEIALRYLGTLSNLGDLILPPNAHTNWHLFVVRTKKRDQLAIFLKNRGIHTAIHYPVPIHLTRAFSSLGYTRGDFPAAERNSRETLSLPLFPELTMREADIVVEKIREFFRKNP